MDGWVNFNPRYYLEEYYSHIKQENQELLKFLTRSYEALPQGLDVIDIGSGPTAYQLISASKVARSITCAEFLEQNINELSRWVRGERSAFNWGEFTSQILELEDSKNSEEEILFRENLTRSKINDILQLDIKREIPLKFQSKFGIASVQFVPESITDSLAEYQKCLIHICSLIKPGGYIIMSAIKSAKKYRVGDSFFPATSVEKETVIKYLCTAGILKHSIKYSDVLAENEGHGYGGLMFFFAQKEGGS